MSLSGVVVVSGETSGVCYDWPLRTTPWVASPTLSWPQHGRQVASSGWNRLHGQRANGLQSSPFGWLVSAAVLRVAARQLNAPQVALLDSATCFRKSPPPLHRIVGLSKRSASNELLSQVAFVRSPVVVEPAAGRAHLLSNRLALASVWGPGPCERDGGDDEAA